MSVFPTFRLPFLAAKAVVDQMDLGDLTALFLCSKKTQKFIKSLRKSVSFVSLSLRQKKRLNFLEIYELFREEKRNGNFLKEYTINYNINYSYGMAFKLDVKFDTQTNDCKNLTFYVYAKCVDRQKRYKKGTKINLAIGDVIVPAVMTAKDYIYTFWPNKQEGFRTIGDYLRQKITSNFLDLFIILMYKPFSEDLRCIINWMNSTNHIPVNCTIFDACNKINKNDMDFVLDNVNPTGRFDISVELGDQVQYNTHFKSERLNLGRAKWFTLDNLLTTESERICLEQSKLRNNDLNEYLKQWTAGKFPKFKELDVEMQEDMNIDEILFGLENSQEHITIARKDDRVLLKRNNECVFEIRTPGKTSKKFEMSVSFAIHRF